MEVRLVAKKLETFSRRRHQIYKTQLTYGIKLFREQLEAEEIRLEETRKGSNLHNFTLIDVEDTYGSILSKSGGFVPMQGVSESSLKIVKKFKCHAETSNRQRDSTRRESRPRDRSSGGSSRHSNASEEESIPAWAQTLLDAHKESNQRLKSLEHEIKETGKQASKKRERSPAPEFKYKQNKIQFDINKSVMEKIENALEMSEVVVCARLGLISHFSIFPCFHCHFPFFFHFPFFLTLMTSSSGPLVPLPYDVIL